MSQHDFFRGDQMSEQEIQRFLADCLPVQDVLVSEGAIPPDPATRELMERMGLPEALIALWVDVSKRPDLQQAFGHIQGTDCEGECRWVYLHEGQKDVCSFILDVALRKPMVIRFRIPIRVADAQWRDFLDMVTLMGRNMNIPIRVYAGPVPDWRTRQEPMEPAQVKKQLQKDAHREVKLTLTQEIIGEMQQHYDAWLRRFPPEQPALSQLDPILRFLIPDVSDLTPSELAESLINIARQLQQLPDQQSPLRGNMNINGEIPVKSHARSSPSLRFLVTSVAESQQATFPAHR